MKHFRTPKQIVIVAALLTILAPAYVFADMVELRGSVYNKNTGRKIQGLFLIRTYDSDGSGGAILRKNGFYDGIQLNSTVGDLDIIEVVYKYRGRLYVQQYRLPKHNLQMGMDLLGYPPSVMQYDFYLDIIE